MRKSDVVNQIKERILLSSVVRQAIELKGHGSHFLGLCPFHQEKTPSFNVRDHVGTFKCFGCGASGDVFAFLMRLRGIAFPEALRELSEKAGLSPIAPSKNKLTPSALKRDELLLKAQSVAHRFFVDQLASPEAHHAVEYLVNKRRLQPSMIKQAALGFGGTSTKNFLEYLLRHGVNEQVAIEAGLLKAGTYSRVSPFLDRLIFPIKRADGKVVAFGGRALKDEQGIAKYVNTHAYVHYEKKKQFYGHYESLKGIQKGLTPVLVEGYFDAMAFWACGVPALALCGTALSDEHLSVLKSLSKKLLICFDADEAGFKALKSSLTKLWRIDIKVGALVLKENDPGDYLANGQLNALKELAGAPIDATCMAIDKVAMNIGTDISRRIAEIDDLLPIFASINRPLIRRQYVAYLAQKMHEDASILWAEINARVKKERPKTTTVEHKEQLSPNHSEEKWLLQIVYSSPSLIDEIPESLWAYFSEELRQDLKKNVSDRKNKFDHELLLSEPEARAMLKALEERLQKIAHKKALALKRQELLQAEKKKDFHTMFKTMKEQSTLLAKNKRPKIETKVAMPAASIISPIKINNLAAAELPAIDFESGEDWL